MAYTVPYFQICQMSNVQAAAFVTDPFHRNVCRIGGGRLGDALLASYPGEAGELDLSGIELGEQGIEALLDLCSGAVPIRVACRASDFALCPPWLQDLQVEGFTAKLDDGDEKVRYSGVKALQHYHALATLAPHVREYVALGSRHWPQPQMSVRQ